MYTNICAHLHTLITRLGTLKLIFLEGAWTKGLMLGKYATTQAKSPSQINFNMGI
jgi:hypothetical protein